MYAEDAVAVMRGSLHGRAHFLKRCQPMHSGTRLPWMAGPCAGGSKMAGGKGLGMDAQIRIAGGTGEELAALGEWLGCEDELRGRIRAVRGPIGETDLGAVTELLTVALGAGGAGTVLASSLKTWLVARRTTAKITVESAGRSVTLDVQTVGEMAPLLEQILKTAGD